MSAFRRFLNSETGPRTVHFWAPVLKWSLVIAGINDIKRPVESLSGTQQIALCATGVIWTRWSLIIKPKNILLASVNFFLGGVAGYQLSRIIRYRRDQGDSVGDIANYIVNGPQKKAVAAPGGKVSDLVKDDKIVENLKN